MFYASERSEQPIGICAGAHPFDMYSYTHHAFTTKQARAAWIAECPERRHDTRSYSPDTRDAIRRKTIIMHSLPSGYNVTA